MTTKNRLSRSDRRRAGAVLLVALAAVVVVTAIAGAVVATTLRTHQSRKTERDMVQLELLCDAGLLRARQQLSKNRDYVGEDWQLGPAVIGDGEWNIAISIVPNSSSSSESNSSRALQVRARIDGRAHAPASIQRTYIVPISRIQP